MQSNLTRTTAQVKPTTPTEDAQRVKRETAISKQTATTMPVVNGVPINQDDDNPLYRALYGGG
jgi:hypothetical protein